MGTDSPLNDDQVIGGYEIIDKLECHHNGAVYRGLDPERDRAVIIRVLRTDIFWTAALEERFRNDYSTIAALQHPHIAAVYTIGQERDFPYVVTESLGPRTLSSLIEQRAELPVETKLSMFMTAARAIGYAHQHGVLHLELTPHKIHIATDDVIKIRDFSLAMLLNQYPSSSEPPQPSSYTAPEVIRGQGGDARTDIFSLGASFYEFFTFFQPTCDDLSEMRFHEIAPFAAIPPSLWVILKTCLARDPRERYGSMDELAAAIKTMLDAMSEDCRMIQEELQAAIAPLEQFVTQTGAKHEQVNEVRELLTDIQRLSSEEGQPHYALLERLMHTLIALSPLIHENATEAKAEAITEVPPSGIVDCEPGQAAVTPDRQHDYDFPADTPIEIPTTHPPNDPIAPVATAPAATEPDKNAIDFGSLAAEVVASETNAFAHDSHAEVRPAIPQPELQISQPSEKNGFEELNIDVEPTYSNLDQLMDELICQHPKLQDIDSTAGFEVYTPPWAAAEAAETTTSKPAAIPVSSQPTMPPEPALDTPSRFNANTTTAPVSPVVTPPANAKEADPAALEAAPAKLKPTAIPVSSSPGVPLTPTIEPPSRFNADTTTAPVSPVVTPPANAKEADPAALELIHKMERINPLAPPAPTDPEFGPIPPVRRNSSTQYSNRQAQPNTVASEKLPISQKAVALAAVGVLLLSLGLVTWKVRSTATSDDQLQEVIIAPLDAIHPLESANMDKAKSQIPDEALPKVANAPTTTTPIKPELDENGKKLLAQITNLINNGQFQEARNKIEQLRRNYPEATALSGLRRKIQSAEKAAQNRKKTRTVEIDLQQQLQQRQQRTADLYQQVAGLLAIGKYDEADNVLIVWQSEEPDNQQAQALAFKIDEIRKNRRAYATALAEHHYTDAQTILRNLEQLNPGDPALVTMRRQITSRRESARANLTIYRLGETGSLFIDGQSLGKNGEVESTTIPIGHHSIAVESNGKTVATQDIDFFEGQRLTLVYDVTGHILRPLTESDRATIERRRDMERGYSFAVEHQHGVLRGSCRGTLLVNNRAIVFKPFSGEHSFNIPLEQIQLGEVSGRTIELLDAENNQKLQTLKFDDNANLQQFRKRLAEIREM